MTFFRVLYPGNSVAAVLRQIMATEDILANCPSDLSYAGMDLISWKLYSEFFEVY